jgi:purine-binding chemotaxis protein CheW
MSRILTFSLAGEEYGVDIRVVHEIISALPITRVPMTPERVRGVINLRGSVIPVIDLKPEFDLPVEEGEFCIVVVRVNGIDVGVVVDRVSDVVELGEDAIQPVPEFGGDRRSECLLGLAHVGQRLCLIIDIERALLDGVAR